MGTDHLTWFNELPAGAARMALLECCSAPGWAELIAAGRPYRSAADAVRQSGEIVGAMTIAELGEALAGHPRIGERPVGSRDGTRTAAWSRREQSGVDDSGADISQALAEGNLEYEQRFGHIYLVCASGLTGTELLAMLRDRLQHESGYEWQVVRGELQKINALRLERFLAGSP
jgi:2-oxo-4-hydroxy-4-carboxy-5-ureidoimidazoline decarboxylase